MLAPLSCSAQGRWPSLACRSKANGQVGLPLSQSDPGPGAAAWRVSVGIPGSSPVVLQPTVVIFTLVSVFCRFILLEFPARFLSRIYSLLLAACLLFREPIQPLTPSHLPPRQSSRIPRYSAPWHIEILMEMWKPSRYRPSFPSRPLLLPLAGPTSTLVLQSGPT